VPGNSIAHADLAKGGSLIFQLTDRPPIAS
jgi:hypothetical protein